MRKNYQLVAALRRALHRRERGDQVRNNGFELSAHDEVERGKVLENSLRIKRRNDAFYEDRVGVGPDLLNEAMIEKMVKVLFISFRAS